MNDAAPVDRALQDRRVGARPPYPAASARAGCRRRAPGDRVPSRVVPEVFMRRGLFLVVSCAGLAACVGELGDAPGDSSNPPLQPQACGVAVQPGPAPIRRMTRFEYDNTVRDLLGDTTHPAADFGAEEEALGFNNNAANLVTSSALAEKYMVAAEGIA